MASVFLSYDHGDAGRAAPIAAALENAGHSVWWDRHIHGGAEYNSEIEGAVERADAVVVLWSKRSVGSAWVRDEAGEGRDQGKLIPVLLEPVKPPMGFRQFQTLNLSQWKKRGDSAMKELLHAVDKLGKGGTDNGFNPRLSVKSTRRISPLLTAVLAVSFLLVAVLFWRPWKLAEATPSVTVVAGDERRDSRSLAANLLVQLGSLQTADADALQLVEPTGSKADLTFKVGALVGSPEPRANLALIDNREGALLWSREFIQTGGNEADLRQQLAYSAGQVLHCATDALEPGQPKLDPSTLKLYLKGCADLSAASTDPRTAIPIFRQVTLRAPRFAGAWGKLLIAELEAFKSTGATDPRLQNNLRQHVIEARKIDRDLAETYLVQSWLQAPRPIQGWMRFADEALEKNPNNAPILVNHAIGLGHVGQMREAIEDARRATQVEPLSPHARQMLIVLLMDSGALEAARRELSDAERLWPGASDILHARFLLEFRYGDPKRAAELLESGDLDFVPTKFQTSFLQARMARTLANIERAIEDAHNAYQKKGSFYAYIQVLAEFDRKDDVIALLLSAEPREAPGIVTAFFRTPFAEVRRDPRFMLIAKRYGLIEYWRATGRWPDFCFEADLPYDCKKEAAKHGW